MLRTSEINIFFDGSAKMESQTGGIGIVITDKRNNEIVSLSVPVESVTSNEAEYRALIYSLEIYQILKKKWSISKALLLTDSKLIYNQVLGKFKVHDEKLHTYLNKAKSLMTNQIELVLVKRKENKLADGLAKLPLGGGKT